MAKRFRHEIPFGGRGGHYPLPRRRRALANFAVRWFSCELSNEARYEELPAFCWETLRERESPFTLQTLMGTSISTGVRLG